MYLVTHREALFKVASDGHCRKEAAKEACGDRMSVFETPSNPAQATSHGNRYQANLRRKEMGDASGERKLRRCKRPWAPGLWGVGVILTTIGVSSVRLMQLTVY
jgi:hypothetical protein